MNTICNYSIEEYKKLVEDFHGHLAPGMLIGGFMMDLALKNRTDCEFYDVLCETATCLPDAIQLLTPCTYGNGWMKVIDIGRFALTVFDKYNGNGTRVNISSEKLDNHQEIKNWFFKLKRKDEQDKDLLFKEITEAGTNILDIKSVTVAPDLVGKKKGKKIVICSKCSEAFPLQNGAAKLCRACSGEILYTHSSGFNVNRMEL